LKCLQEAGYYTVESVVYAPRKKLTDIKERFFPCTEFQIFLQLCKLENGITTSPYSQFWDLVPDFSPPWILISPILERTLYRYLTEK
jgi:hypothetical protein